MSNPVFEKFIKDIEGASFARVSATLDPRGVALMNDAADLFEPCPYTDQATVLAILFGMLCANTEGADVEFEREGVLIGFEERLRIFTAVARVTFNESLQFRNHPDCPNPTRSVS